MSSSVQVGSCVEGVPQPDSMRVPAMVDPERCLLPSSFRLTAPKGGGPRKSCCALEAVTTNSCVGRPSGRGVVRQLVRLPRMLSQCTGVQNDRVLEFNFARWLEWFRRDRVASKCHDGRLIYQSLPFESLLLHAKKKRLQETAWRRNEFTLHAKKKRLPENAWRRNVSTVDQYTGLYRSRV